MRFLGYLIVAAISAFLGYKLGEAYTLNKSMKSNVVPIVDELRKEYQSVLTSLQNGTLSPADQAALAARKDQILTLLGKFYGKTKDEINKLING